MSQIIPAPVSVNDFRPAREFAQQFGVKGVMYGKPGAGKTPLAAMTTPRPLLLLSEPGALTLRGCDIPTYPAFNPEKIAGFFEWLKLSNDAKNYDTIIWDSVSEGCEIYLSRFINGGSKGGNKAHGQAAYGDMSREMMKHINQLYFMPQKHVILISKRGVVEDMGVQVARPIMPGKELNTRIPHLFDLVMQLGVFPGVHPENKPMLQCKASFDAEARDRSGALQQYEPAHLGAIFKKCMAPL